MKMRNRPWLPLLLVVLMAPAVQARGRGGEDGFRPHRHPPRVRSLDDAVGLIRHRTHGRILSAEPFSDDDERGYRVKVLTPDGRVRVFRLERDD